MSDRRVDEASAALPRDALGVPHQPFSCYMDDDHGNAGYCEECEVLDAKRLTHDGASAAKDEALWTAASLIDEACVGGTCPNAVDENYDCDAAGIDPSNWCWWCMARGWLKAHAPANYPGPGVVDSGTERNKGEMRCSCGEIWLSAAQPYIKTGGKHHRLMSCAAVEPSGAACEGTACDRPATKHLLIRAAVREAFGDPSADDSVVERLYCDECAVRAERREMSEVISSTALNAPDETSADAPTRVVTFEFHSPIKADAFVEAVSGWLCELVEMPEELWPLARTITQPDPHATTGPRYWLYEDASAAVGPYDDVTAAPDLAVVREELGLARHWLDGLTHPDPSGNRALMRARGALDRIVDALAVPVTSDTKKENA